MQTSLTLPKPIQLLLAPPAAAIQEFFGQYQTWVETVLGGPVSDAITFEFHLPFDHLVLDQMFAGIPLDRRSVPYTKMLQPVVSKWELPPNSAPRIELTMSRNREGGLAQGKFGWHPDWNALPLAVWLKGCTHGIVSAEVT